MPVVPHTYAQIDNESVPDLYKYTGNIECAEYTEGPTVSVITNGTMWIFRDMKLRTDNLQKYKDTYGVINTNINWSTFSLTNILHEVAKFFSNLDRGAGIDLYWVTTPFTMPVVPHTYAQIDNESVPNLYKYTGDIECAEYHDGPTVSVITNGTMWIFRDMKLRADDRDKYKEIFGNGDMNTLIASNRNDELYGDFIKFALPSRTGFRAPDGKYRTIPRNHAEWSGQGAHIDVVSISEEKAIENKPNYTALVFAEVIGFCIGHEMFHLITDGNELANTPPFDQPGPLMGLVRLLSLVTITGEELSWVDLPNRKSIKRD